MEGEQKNYFVPQYIIEFDRIDYTPIGMAISLRKLLLISIVAAMASQILTPPRSGGGSSHVQRARRVLRPTQRPDIGYGKMCKGGHCPAKSPAAGGDTNPWTSFISGRKSDSTQKAVPASGGFLTEAPFSRMVDTPIPPMITNYQLQNVAKDNTGWRDSNWAELVFV